MIATLRSIKKFEYIFCNENCYTLYKMKWRSYMNIMKKICLFFVLVSLSILGHSIAMETDDDLDALFRRSKGMTSPHLFNKGIDDDKACRLAKIIKNNKTITDLNLGNNQISNTGIKALSQSFRTMKLKRLDLFGNRIEDEGFYELFSALKQVKTLTYLNIIGNKIGPVGTEMLDELLAENPRLYNQTYKEVPPILRTCMRCILCCLDWGNWCRDLCSSE